MYSCKLAAAALSRIEWHSFILALGLVFSLERLADIKTNMSGSMEIWPNQVELFFQRLDGRNISPRYPNFQSDVAIHIISCCLDVLHHVFLQWDTVPTQQLYADM